MSVLETDLNELLAEFAEESLTALRQVPASLKQYRSAPDNLEPINAVFRAIHSIKGNAGFFGLGALTSFAHGLEGSLDEIRTRRIPLSDNLESALVLALDELDAMLADLSSEQGEGELTTSRQELLERVRRATHQPGDNDAPLVVRLSELADEMSNSGLPQGVKWSRRIEAWLAQTDRNPSDHQTTERTPDQPRITSGKAPTESASKAKSTDVLKQRIVRVKEEQIETIHELASDLFATTERLDELYLRLAESGAPPALVDEIRRANQAFTIQSLALHRNIAAFRHVPASSMFSKFARLARQLAEQLGKQVEVQIRGDETEIPKGLIEPLDASLTHIVRNMMDHGIETPEQRLAKGASPRGTLRFEARQRGNELRISVGDDGRGIDPARLRETAVVRGVVRAEDAAAMADEEAIQLIFHPGFSTARQLSNISGRGVGMDVVRTSMREHGGDVLVESRVGQGTTFHLVIPLGKPGAAK
jgi:two-component system chemotaxis sensor kinase CheA